jgi:predicted nuclease of predicted toxin-antitoxin system
MIVWVDAQLPPALATWLRETFGIDAVAVRDVGLREAADEEIFQAARAANAVVVTKDADFIALVERLGPPPQIVWVTCGNTSNARLREVSSRAWPDAQALLEKGEPLVEISDRRE